MATSFQKSQAQLKSTAAVSIVPADHCCEASRNPGHVRHLAGDAARLRMHGSLGDVWYAGHEQLLRPEGRRTND
ncbi:MAG: hypothetical protein IT483_08425 [Gammaproteobacteria bacterium]|jgi:hypothetical protein|nr:hypothetical protein [Gammaproteobacteria bacterium]